MASIRILHAVSTLHPRVGGPPVAAASLAAAQAALGHRVTVLAYDEPVGPQPAPNCLDQLPGGFRVTPTLLPVPGRLERLTGVTARVAVRAVVAAADVVHLHGVWDPLIFWTAAAARRANVPYVVAPHGMLDGKVSLRQKAGKKQLALALGFRRMLDRAAAFHLLNDVERDMQAALRLRPPVVILPNGVDLAQVDPLPPADAFRRQQPWLGDSPYVLFLGRLHPIKGLDQLAEAFALLANRVPAVKLVVAGPDDGAKADFEARIAKHGLQQRARAVGPLYGAAKWAAFAGATLFCLPSRYEGFGIVLIESLACRVPVVISDACNFREVEPLGCGRVVPLEPRALADALADLLADPAKAAAMGRRGRELVEERWTWPAVAERSLAAYEALRAGKVP